MAQYAKQANISGPSDCIPPYDKPYGKEEQYTDIKPPPSPPPAPAKAETKPKPDDKPKPVAIARTPYYSVPMSVGQKNADHVNDPERTLPEIFLEQSPMKYRTAEMSGGRSPDGEEWVNKGYKK